MAESTAPAAAAAVAAAATADVELTNYQAVKSIVAANGAELPPQDAIVALLAEQRRATGAEDEGVGDSSFGSASTSSTSSSSRARSATGSSSSTSSTAGSGTRAIVLNLGKDAMPFRVLARADGPSSRVVYKVEWERSGDASSSHASSASSRASTLQPPMASEPGGGSPSEPLGSSVSSLAAQGQLTPSSGAGGGTTPTPRPSPAAMLKKQGRKVLRGPRSIPNLRLHATNRSASAGATTGAGGGGGGGGRTPRPALPALSPGFQQQLAVPFPGELSAPSTNRPPQLALTQYSSNFGKDTASSGTTAASAGSPRTRAAAALTEGDVWGALLGTSEDGEAETSRPVAPTSASRHRETTDVGLGLDVRSGATLVDDDSLEGGDVGEGGLSTDGAIGHGESDQVTGFGQARQRRRLQALQAAQVDSNASSGGGSGHLDLSPLPKLQHVSREGGAGGAPTPLRSASIGRGNWRSVSPFGPSVLVKQTNLRKVASSGLRNVRTLHNEPTSAPAAPNDERNRAFLSARGPAPSSLSSTQSPGSPELSDAATPSVADSQTPRIHPQLREAPSFTSSSGSHRTARGGGSDAHTLMLGSEAPTDLQGLGEDAELVLQYPAEPLSRAISPAVGADSDGGARSYDASLLERLPAAFRPFWERSKPDDPTLIFDVFQAYAQVNHSDETDAKRLSLTAMPGGASPIVTDSHKRSESVDSIAGQGGKGVSASPSLATVQGGEASPMAGAGSGERNARNLSTSAAQSSTAGGAPTMPADDPRFAIWTIRGPDQPPIVSIGAEAFTSQHAPSDVADPVVSPKVGTSATSRFSVRPPATPETPARDRSRTYNQSPFASVADTSDMATPTAASTEPRRRQNRGTNLREDVLLPLDRPTLLAATKSRLVAELTSEIDSRMLTDFFFTYRLYMTPCELFRLLSLRFQWALGQPCSPHDEARRRIVRVRTYTVLKYWLTHLFEYDFLSDGELRTSLTRWLNSLAKDPALANRDADLAIVKSLKKTVRELKGRYSQSGVGGLLAGDPGVLSGVGAAETRRRAESNVSTSTYLSDSDKALPAMPAALSLTSPKLQDDVDLILSVDGQREAGEDNGAPPSRVTSMAQSGRVRSGSETLAPSWLEQRRASTQPAEGGAGNDNAANLPAQPFLTAPFSMFDDATEASGFMPPSADFAASHGDEPVPETMMIIQPATSVQNPLSKAISNTVTRLTKIGRALGSRGTLTVPFSNESGTGSSNDQEAVELTDLLADPRQLQFFIDALRNSQAIAASEVAEKPMLEPTAEETEPTSSSRTSFLEPGQTESESSQSDGTNLDNTPGLSDASASTPASSVRHRDSVSGESIIRSRPSSMASALGLGLGLDDQQKTTDETPPADPLPTSLTMTKDGDTLHRYTSNQTLRTLESVDRPLTSGLAAAPTLRDLAHYRATVDDSSPNVVQIDDIDLSSDEDDGVVRRALRRLPGARDLRTTNNVRDLGAAEPRQSFDSFSMMSGHGPVKAAYSSIPASLVGSQRSGSWQDGMTGLIAPTFPDKIGTVTTELLDPDEALAGYELVKGFRLDDVDSDEDEPGDVETALRRLEGVIDEEKQREKVRRVERMFQESQARIAARERMAKRATVAILSEEGGHHTGSGSARDSLLSKTASRLEGISDAFEVKDSAAVAAGERHSVDGATLASTDVSSTAPRGLFPPIKISESGTPPSDDASSPKPKLRTYAEQRSPFLRSRPALGSPKGGRPPLPTGSNTDASVGRGPRPITFMPGGDVRRLAGRTTRQGRVLMNATTNPGGVANAAGAASTPSPRAPLALPVMHYSFLLNSAPETIAQQFTLIEAELFKAVTWDELVSGRWKERTLEALDWETFFQRTGRRKAECIAAGQPYKERAVDAIIARFNLMCGWVASEVVLTQGIELRAKLLSKLIRIAWKCYEQHNHATLTQILVGLQFPAVERLHKTWARLPAKHRRIFKDLKTFTSPSRNFAYLRGAIQAKVLELGMVEMMMTTGLSTSSTRNPFSLTPFAAPSGGGGGGGGAGVGGAGGAGGGVGGSGGAMDGSSKSKKAADAQAGGFVPFFGLFTSTLASAEALPTFIDPSAPTCPVDMDPSTGELRSLANPDAFAHLPPLPPSIKLEPLVNLFKARALALTVKTIAAFQERAAQYSFEADRNLYVKCLKVRSLQGHQQASLSAFVEP